MKRLVLLSTLILGGCEDGNSPTAPSTIILPNGDNTNTTIIVIGGLLGIPTPTPAPTATPTVTP